VTAPAATIVYDNTAESLGQDAGIGTEPNDELGNQITLAGTARIVTEFLFGYATAGPGPRVRATVRFRANDGAKGAPGTLLFESDPISLHRVHLGWKTSTLSGLGVAVPDTFTWTVSFNETDLSGFVVGYGPPTVGSCGDLWLHGDIGWWTHQFETSTHQKASSLMARVTAAPPLPHAHWSEEVEAQILLGVINDAGGFIRLGGHIGRVPPRQPVEAILAALPAELAQQLVPLLRASPHGKQPEAALRQQLAHAIVRYQEQSRG
jgi:hypothetical protein